MSCPGRRARCRIPGGRMTGARRRGSRVYIGEHQRIDQYSQRSYCVDAPVHSKSVEPPLQCDMRLESWGFVPEHDQKLSRAMTALVLSLRSFLRCRSLFPARFASISWGSARLFRLSLSCAAAWMSGSEHRAQPSGGYGRRTWAWKPKRTRVRPQYSKN